METGYLGIWARQLGLDAPTAFLDKVGLDEESRLKILRIKSMCWSRPEYRRRAWDYWKTERSYGGFDIYKAVLDKGVSSFDDWERHLSVAGGQNCAG